MFPDARNGSFRDVIFSQWLDISNTAVNWLWLQGIPGAGKTYLTAMAIDHIRKRQQALFALVSHANKTTLKALHVMQSLVFQAAEDDRDFQSILVETKERELQGTTEHAADLLKMLPCSLPERPISLSTDSMKWRSSSAKILLRYLGEISLECKNLRVLISSRTEDDITRMLEQRATNIRVDDRNYGSIQIYVDYRFQQLVASRQFGPDDKSELLNLISPLSAKANSEAPSNQFSDESFKASNSAFLRLNDRHVLVRAYHRGQPRVHDS